MGAEPVEQAVGIRMFLFIAEEVVECQDLSELEGIGRRVSSDELPKSWHPALTACLRHLYATRQATLKTIASFAESAETVELSKCSGIMP